MIELMSAMPENVLAFRASGMVTAEDYEEVLIPAIETALQIQDKARVLFLADPGLEGFTPGAMWDDAKFGLSHFFSFEKFALVSDTDWINNSVKVFGFMMPCPVKVFALDQLEAAKSWVSG